MAEKDTRETKNQYYIAIGIFLILFSTSMISVMVLNNSYGSLNVSTVSIPYEGSRLSGFLYRPIDASEDNKLPTVICAHGVSNSKFTMSGIALEVARRGFITLSLDLSGHGNSESISNDDSTLGITAAIAYLSSLPFANSSTLAVIGHSMGAGAARATAISHGNVTATVLIGGATSDITNNFNSTFPKNLLIAVGEYDEFYRDVTLLTTELAEVFGTISPIIPNHEYYGSFAPENQNARRLVISETIHILEPIDPMIVSETVDWIQNALKPLEQVDEYYLPSTNLIYTFRDISLLLALFSIVGIFFPLIFLIYDLPAFSQEKEKFENQLDPLPIWKTSLIWGTLLILLYLPLSVIGMMLPIPPMRFASSIALWLLCVAIILVGAIYFLPRYFGSSFTINKDKLLQVREWLPIKGGLLAIAGFLSLYCIMFLFYTLLTIQFGFVIAIFSNILVMERLISFVIVFPVFIVYFTIDGLFFHATGKQIDSNSDLQEKIVSLSKFLLAKSWPFLIFTPIYILRILFGVNLLPGGLMALSFQFYLVIGILFFVGSVMTWLWYRASKSIFPGAIFNSLIFVWILASALPV